MKKFIIKDILNNMYFWEYRIEEGFDLDIREATKYNSREDAEKMFDTIKSISNYERFLEVKEIYVI